MKRTSSWIIVFLMVMAAGALTLGADEHTDGPEMLAQIYKVKVLPGHALEFEKALKNHQQMHRAAGDPWESHAWVVVAGDGAGTYYLRRGNLTWAKMDEEHEVPNDEQDVMENISPHVKHISIMFSEIMPKVSNWPADDGIPRMVEVTMFTLDYDRMDDFFYGMHKLHQMIVEKELPYTYSWSKVVVGGSGAQVYLSMPRNSWSEFAEPSPSLWEVAAEAMGKRESEELRRSIGAAIESEESFVVAFRPDLSYIPE